MQAAAYGLGVRSLSEIVIAWGGLLATLALVGVTIWYAIQTQRTARSARDSARYASEAAKQSARAAAIAAAGTDVDFHLSPTYLLHDDTDMRFSGVQLVPAGAAVFLHDVVLVEAWSLWADEKPQKDSWGEQETFPDGKLPSLRGLAPIPLLAHRGESLFLVLSPEDQPVEAHITRLEVQIQYSFDGDPNGPLRVRTVKWEGKFGRDFS
jgi:hypothetical protein